ATLEVYSRAAEAAAGRGVLLADTKFEFGLADGQLVLADEVLTPDSSRYWPADGYEAGRVQPSFDKQYVRDWLTGPDSGWDRSSDQPPPPLPREVVEATRARYIEAYERISGLSFDDWIGGDAACMLILSPGPTRPSPSADPSGVSTTDASSSTSTSGCATRTRRRRAPTWRRRTPTPTP